MIKKGLIGFIVLVLLYACDFFKEEDNRVPVARVNDTYLYQESITDLTTDAMSPEDSVVIVNNYVTRWATQQLLMDGALRNLSDEKQKEFSNLVEQYKNDLFTKAYIEALVSRNIDSTVTLFEAQKYYEENIDIFKLNEELIKFRYINIDENHSDFDTIEKKFKRFNNDDKKELDSVAIQFKSYSLNDSIWVKVSQVLEKIPVANATNKDELLKKSNFIQLKDSIGVYLMHINDVLLRNDTAPLEYVKPTIDQIVINKRKLEYIKELKTDITKDAIKSKQFEIFN